MPRTLPISALLDWATHATATATATDADTDADADTQPQPQPQPYPHPHPQPLNTDLLDTILGRSNAVLLRENFAVFHDPVCSLADRQQAAETIEHLVQDIDNANDLEPLALWPKLIDLLAATDDVIKFHACWISGTAVQNNPKAQQAFLKKDPIPLLLPLLSSENHELQAKSIYCLSATLKHAPPETKALRLFVNSGGWFAIEPCLRGPSLMVRKKIVFFINTLGFLHFDSLQDAQASLIDPIESSGVLTTLIKSLYPTHAIINTRDGDLVAQDDDYIDKTLRTLTTLCNVGQSINKENRLLINFVVEKFMISFTDDEWGKKLSDAGIAKEEWKVVLSLAGFS